jgi:uncharacterized protein (DUF885 family)
MRQMRWIKKFWRVGVAAGLLTVMNGGMGATAAHTPPDWDRSQPPMRGLIERFRADQASLDHVWGVPGAPGVFQRERRFLREWEAALATVDFATLDRAGQVDWILFQEELRFRRGALKRQQARFAELAELLPFDGSIARLELDRRRLRFAKPRSAADLLHQLTQEVQDTQAALEKRLAEADDETPFKRTVAWRAVRRVKELRGFLRAWRRFYEGYDPLFTWWVPEPAQALDRALEQYGVFLREKIVGVKKGEADPVIGDPIGDRALRDALRHEFIAYTPEELIRIAEREFAWCEAEGRKAATELGFDGDWHRALEYVKQQHVPPGQQPRFIRQEARAVIRFVEERDLLTIPPLAKESWRMEMMTPAQQRMTPYFTGGETINVSFPTAAMRHVEKLMSLHGNNRHFCHAVVHHELIPGHHLQLFMADRYQTQRKLFTTPFLIEGWALYWEMKLWDLGFARDAADRVGMLFWRMHRCARIIFSLKFHREEWTAQEAIDFLVERVGHERNNATAEVRRSVSGEYSPLYQAAYMVGGLQLRALHEELVGGERMTEREFNDAVLRENSIPIELIRADLGAEDLIPDFRASWRFYPALP